MPSQEYDTYLSTQTGTSGETWLAQKPNVLSNSQWVSWSGEPAALGTLLNTCPQAGAFAWQSQALEQAARAPHSIVTGSPSWTELWDRAFRPPGSFATTA